jgi:hypothetical protein
VQHGRGARPLFIVVGNYFSDMATYLIMNESKAPFNSFLCDPKLFILLWSSMLIILCIVECSGREFGNAIGRCGGIISICTYGFMADSFF